MTVRHYEGALAETPKTPPLSLEGPIDLIRGSRSAPEEQLEAVSWIIPPGSRAITYQSGDALARLHSERLQIEHFGNNPTITVVDFRHPGEVRSYDYHNNLLLETKADETNVQHILDTLRPMRLLHQPVGR